MSKLSAISRINSPVGRAGKKRHLQKKLHSDLSFEMILEGRTGFEQLEWREGKKQL